MIVVILAWVSLEIKLMNQTTGKVTSWMCQNACFLIQVCISDDAVAWSWHKPQLFA